MHFELFLAALVLAVAVLVAVDLLRRTDDGALEHAEGPPHDSEREIVFPPSRIRTAAFTGTGAAEPRTSSHGMLSVQRNWHVRARLSLLAVASAVTATVVTASVLHALDAMNSAASRSDVSSVRDGATASAIVAILVAVAALAVGVWSATLLIRSVLRPLHQLRAGAVELAEVRLPDALRHVGPADGEPKPADANGEPSLDEIGQIARAFDQVQGEVLRLAGNEAGLRGRLSELFVDLARRSQSLLERQARLIDDLEQGERNSERLAGLVTLDHIATRMRRYSQNLLVLAGHELPGRWHQPVTLADVIRAAVSEIEQYERVSFTAQPGIAIAGPAVNDMVHLIAELTENATSLSTADTPVDVSGRALAAGGVLIDITDQGVGMSPERMAQANWRLDHPSDADITVSKNMGLLVAGRLASRHGARIRLQPADSGGLTALVWLPDAIVVAPDMAAASAPGGFDHVMSRPGAHEAIAQERAVSHPFDPAPAGPPAGAVISPMPAPTLEDSDVTFGRRRIPAHPAPKARPAPRARLLSRRPPAPAPPATSAPAQAAANLTRDTALPSAGPAGAATEPHPPIYAAVESDWFRTKRKTPGGPATPTSSWASPADPAWQAAKALTEPSSGGLTSSGLPVRVPRANLVPGTLGGQAPDAPTRSAVEARDRLAGFQRGFSQGRAAAGHPWEGDDTSGGRR